MRFEPKFKMIFKLKDTLPMADDELLFTIKNLKENIVYHNANERSYRRKEAIDTIYDFFQGREKEDFGQMVTLVQYNDSETDPTEIRELTDSNMELRNTILSYLNGYMIPVKDKKIKSITVRF